MIYSYNDVLRKYRDDYNIKKAVNKKELFKIEKGIYSDTLYVNHLSILMKKYPYGVISGHSAYYYQNLTNVIPRNVTLCTNRNATRINNFDIKQIRMKDELYELGITTINYNGTMIRIYDKERLLIDLIRNKNKMGYDLYKEIIGNYRNIVDSLDITKIENYLTHFNNQDKILMKMQDEVF